MYITNLIIKNIRNISTLSIDFNSKSRSIILSGNNGSGKSTILRCLAMGTSDEDSAASVLRDMSGDFVKKGQIEGIICVNLVHDNGQKFRIETKIKSLKAFEKVDQKVYINTNSDLSEITQENFPWHKIFIAGYGAGVRNLGTADYQHYVPIDALYSLFKYDVALQNPELSMRRLIESAREKSINGDDRGTASALQMEKYLTNILKQVLNLESNDEVKLTSTNIEIKSKWGRQELSTLGDGYISTTTWILDLFSWWMLHLKLSNKKILVNKVIKGIVLIDEIEQHLHPIWQVKIIKLLRESFPKIQFISTTHSPLVISSDIDVPVMVLKDKPEIIMASGWLAEDVYRDIMGLTSSRNEEIKKKIEEYKKLHLKKINKEISRKDTIRLRSLKKELLDKLPRTDPIVEVDELKNITEFLKQSNAKR